ncbi:MAG: type IV pilus assembly protein PilA [Lentimonas sp.]|jgi:type IV pilus assembly protein PilA
MQKQSKKGFTLVEIMIVVVIIGLLAAMAVPAFTKVRATSQNKAIVNNMRQITSAADQYFLENGVTVATLATDLIGAELYIKSLKQVAKETYPTTITQGSNYTVTGLPADVGGSAIDEHKPTAASTTLSVTF